MYKLKPNTLSFGHEKWSIIIFFSLNVLITFIVSFVPVDPETKIIVAERIDEMRNVVGIEGLGVPYIFGNNLMLTIPSFVPLVGLGWSLTLAYNNGVAFSTLNISRLMFLMPFFILEYLANSIAVTEGFRIIKSILSKKPFKEIEGRTLRNIGLCALILFVSAIIEMMI